MFNSEQISTWLCHHALHLAQYTLEIRKLNQTQHLKTGRKCLKHTINYGTMFGRTNFNELNKCLTILGFLKFELNDQKEATDVCVLEFISQLLFSQKYFKQI